MCEVCVVLFFFPHLSFFVCLERAVLRDYCISGYLDLYLGQFFQTTFILKYNKENGYATAEMYLTYGNIPASILLNLYRTVIIPTGFLSSRSQYGIDFSSSSLLKSISYRYRPKRILSGRKRCGIQI